jgi:hypothetical protein
MDEQQADAASATSEVRHCIAMFKAALDERSIATAPLEFSATPPIRLVRVARTPRSLAASRSSRARAGSAGAIVSIRKIRFHVAGSTSAKPGGRGPNTPASCSARRRPPRRLRLRDRVDGGGLCRQIDVPWTMEFDRHVQPAAVYCPARS